MPGRRRGDEGLTPVSFTVSAADNCDPTVTCRITGIMELGREWHHGRRVDCRPDWRLLGPLTALLRTDGDADLDDAYQVTIECVDGAGNRATHTFTITLPHEEREHGHGHRRGHDGGKPSHHEHHG